MLMLSDFRIALAKRLVELNPDVIIMSSIAQEEARNISENVTWGQRKRFADGKYTMPFKSFLGYERGEDGKPVINEAEAKTVRLIYRLFLQGKTPYAISCYLNEQRIPTATGKNKWNSNTVASILTNEKYKGDALLQKEFTVDYLTKKKKRNEGEVPQYYIENSHPAIIDPSEWDQVQAEFTRRKGIGKAYRSLSVFSSKLICADCGSFFGSKIWHSTDKHRKEVWQCSHKYKEETICATPHLVEEQIQQMFLQAYNELIGNRDTVVEDCELMMETLRQDKSLEVIIEQAIAEMKETAKEAAAVVQENAQIIQTQDVYRQKYRAVEEKYEQQKAAVRELQEKIDERDSRIKQMEVFVETLRKQELVLDQWDPQLWTILLESGTVLRDGSINFTFKDGTQIQAAIK